MPERTEASDAGGTAASVAVGWAGRLSAPVLALIVYWLLPGEPDLSSGARATAAVGTLMAVLWMSEGLPLSVTSLLPLALFAPLGVASMGDAAAPYANPLIFLFMGGFIIALAMERWGLHRRIALRVIALVGTRPATLVGGFMLAAAGLSMWISNTATAVMMLPIGVSVIRLVADELGTDDPSMKRFPVCLLLGLAYACSIGGFGTLIGTPPNVILAGFVRDAYGVEISFGRWMLFGLPFAAVFLVIAWALLTRVIFPVGFKRLEGGAALIERELRDLGPMSRQEKVVLGVFLATALAWIVREPLANWEWLVARAPFVEGLSDPQIAMAAAVLLFAIPVDARRGVFVMDWKTASRIPWDVLLLFGGGLSLAAAVRANGLDAFIGGQVGGLSGAPTWVVVLGVATLIVFLTELTSNTATATTFMPVLAGVADGIGVLPQTLLLPAAVAASCAFMLPVATPPNAIVFGSGRVRIGQMVRAGLLLNVVSILLATIATLTLGPLVFDGLTSAE